MGESYEFEKWGYQRRRGDESRLSGKEGEEGGGQRNAGGEMGGWEDGKG